MNINVKKVSFCEFFATLHSINWKLLEIVVAVSSLHKAAEQVNLMSVDLTKLID